MERKIEQHLMRNILAENDDFKLHLLNSGHEALVRRHDRQLAAYDVVVPEAYAHEPTTRLYRMALELKANLYFLESLCRQPPKELTDLYQQHVNGMHRHAMTMSNNVILGHAINDPMAQQELLGEAARAHALFHRRFEALQSLDFFEDCNAWHDIECETFAIEKLLPRIAQLDVMISEEMHMMGYEPPIVATSFTARQEKAAARNAKKTPMVVDSVAAARATGDNVVELFPRNNNKGKG